MDKLSPEQRSELMSRIRGKDTRPEWIIRRIVHGLGYRYRLHDAKLPGKPDLVFRRFMKVIFIHGCFWHLHKCRRGRSTPKSNARFWQEKRAQNRKRDLRVRREIRRLGWKVLIVWQCQCTEMDQVTNMLVNFLGDKGRVSAI